MIPRQATPILLVCPSHHGHTLCYVKKPGEIAYSSTFLDANPQWVSTVGCATLELDGSPSHHWMRWRRSRGSVL